MDRDAAYRHIVRRLEHYRGVGRAELEEAASLGTIETAIVDRGETITLYINVRRRSTNSYQIEVSAVGNNWWKHERLDETITVDFDQS